MNYAELVKRVNYVSYFKPEALAVSSKNMGTIQNQLTQWQKKGKIHKLKRGIYTLNQDERRAPLPPILISNILYTPSYVSLESALAYFTLIPEGVHQVMAVSTRKTQQFRNTYGVFYYHHIKSALFFGYTSIRMQDAPILIAHPEKAILDRMYFDSVFRAEVDYFLENLRLQNLERLSSTRLLEYSRRFPSELLRKGAKILADLIREEKTDARHPGKKSKKLS